jgi:hypothetical protein
MQTGMARIFYAQKISPCAQKIFYKSKKSIPDRINYFKREHANFLISTEYRRKEIVGESEDISKTC